MLEEFADDMPNFYELYLRKSSKVLDKSCSYLQRKKRGKCQNGQSSVVKRGDSRADLKEICKHLKNCSNYEIIMHFSKIFSN